MSRNALLSTGIFVVLLVAVFVTRQDSVKVGVKELSLNASAVLPLKSVTVTGGNTATLKEQNGKWTVEGPVNVEAAKDAPKDAKPATKLVGPVAADQTLVDALIKAVSELEATAFVTARKEKHADLQVDEANGKKVVLNGSGAPLSIVIGRTASGGGFFLRKADSDAVFIGKGGLHAAVSRDVTAWRRRTLLGGVEKSAIAAVTVRPTDGSPYTIDNAGAPIGDDGKPGAPLFKLSAKTEVPSGLRIDTDSLGRVAQTAVSLRAAEFADGIAPQVAAIGTGGSLVIKTNDGATTEVKFGATDAKRQRFAQVTGDAQIYLVSGYARDNLVKPLDGHRDLSLFDIQPEAVKRVTFTNGPSVVDVTLTPEGWTLAAPTQLPTGFEFDPSTVAGRISGLLRLRASRVAPATSTAPTAGTTIDVYTDGAEPKRVVIGALSGTDATAKAVVSTTIDPTLYEVAAFVAKRYADPLQQFKKVERPPTPPGGGRGGIQGLDKLPPEIRAQIEAQMRSGQFGR